MIKYPWLTERQIAIRNQGGDIINVCNRTVCDAQDILAKNMVISHRDMEPKNVIWDGMNPSVIDWEASGYVNPYQELLEVVNYWADDGKGSLYKEYFDTIIEAYGKHMSFINVEWDIPADKERIYKRCK